jgi:hypothetical protein
VIREICIFFLPMAAILTVFVKQRGHKSIADRVPAQQYDDSPDTLSQLAGAGVWPTTAVAKQTKNLRNKTPKLMAVVHHFLTE